MATETILLTGSTGYIGSLVLLKLVESGKKVRACVRSLARGSAIKDNPVVAPYAHLLEFVEIPDFQAPGAFDDVLKDVDGVVHLASPIPAEGIDADALFAANVKPVQKLLNTAHKMPDCKVKRMVFANSGSAIVPLPELLGGNYTDKIYNRHSRLSANEIPQPPFEHPGIAYQAGKATSLAWIEKFTSEEKPKFDVVTLMPAWVLGANPTLTKPEELLKSTSFKIMSVLLGDKKPDPTNDACCSVNDVARIFCEALDTKKVEGNTTFLIAKSNFAYNDALSIAEKNFPDAVKKGLLPLGGERDTLPSGVEAKDTEKVFGRLETYEDCVKSTVEQYLNLVEKCGVPDIVKSGEFGGATSLHG